MIKAKFLAQLSHILWRCRASLAGEDIYGPFENGFGSRQDNILSTLGCSPASLGHVQGGIDTRTAEQMIAHACGVTLPRIQGNQYISLLDECGGHTNAYHLHERLSCLYNNLTTTHSTRIGNVEGNRGLYGKWERQNTLPALDACGCAFEMFSPAKPRSPRLS